MIYCVRTRRHGPASLCFVKKSAAKKLVAVLHKRGKSAWIVKQKQYGKKR